MVLGEFLNRLAGGSSVLEEDREYRLPKHAEELFTEHGVGLGVFTMQGYERRNKESKNTLKRFTNHKGNILVQNMKRLWDIFKHSMNSY